MSTVYLSYDAKLRVKFDAVICQKVIVGLRS